MLKGKDIICISSIDWDFLWQQHQAIMSTLAKNGNRVLFIENTGVRAPKISDAPRMKKRILNWLKSTKGFRKEMDNLYVYSPLIIPFPYSRLARLLNKYSMLRAMRRWMKIVNFYDPVIWTFLPTPISLDIKDAIPHKAFIYYCTDNFAATSHGARKVVRYEKEVLKMSDAVFVMARNMLDYCKAYNNNVTCIPMGVDVGIFIDPGRVYRAPQELAGITGRIVGFVGGVRSSIDQELVLSLSGRFPEYTFAFVGPVQTDISALRNIKNLIFLGQKKHSDLPDYIKRFDVCMIPYTKDEYTDNISPAKLNEYLIMGKPVVSANLREVEAFNKDSGNLLYVAHSRDAFIDAVAKAMAENDGSLRQRRVDAAMKNSWEAKIKEMSDIIDNVIARKDDEGQLNWQARMVGIYKTLQVRALRAAAVILVAWAIVFYTPLMWVIAEPLKLSMTPKKADAIVVFAGGVGESGKAGQGYEERVEYAVELYKKGYADHIIFSSGYTYFFKEPLVMKALAVSLGVPEDMIILEEKSKNTFENVMFTRDILGERSWKKILLVTSPYHTKRSFMVFKKNAKELDVTYLPIKKSLFYWEGGAGGRGRWQRINVQQIGGIIHEYLSIIYYWAKGYV